MNLQAAAGPAVQGGGRTGSGLSSCSGDVGGHYVSGMPVEAGARPVVAHGGARIGVRGGFLHVAERDSRVECGGDECVPQGVRRVTRRTIRAAPCRSSRRPSRARNSGPSVPRRWPGRSPWRCAAPAG